MSDPRMLPGAVQQVEPIHHARVFGYDAPTTCGRTEQPKPASSNWFIISCRACMEKAPREVQFTSAHNPFCLEQAAWRAVWEAARREPAAPPSPPGVSVGEKP